MIDVTTFQATSGNQFIPFVVAYYCCAKSLFYFSIKNQCWPCTSNMSNDEDANDPRASKKQKTKAQESEASYLGMLDVLQAEIEKWKTKAEVWEKEAKKAVAEKEELEKGIESRSLKRLITNPPFMKLVQRGGASSASASSAHSKATVHEAVFEIALQPKTNEDGTKSFEFNDVTKFNNLIKIMNSRSSSLLLRFSEPNGCQGEVYCEFWNEADISALIQTALVDATYLAHCVTGKQFAIRNECSIFSLRPDHFVVLEDGVPLLAVENKRPWIDGQNLDHIYGQVYDYTEMMRAFGAAASFVVLTCFEKSHVMWLESEPSDALACNKDSLRDEEKFSASPTTTTGNKCKGITPSPPNCRSPYTTIPRTVSESDEQFGFQSLERDRALNCSKEFKSQQLVPLLYTALLCAVKASPQEQSKLQIPLYDGEILKNHRTIRMKSEPLAYEWGILSARVGKEIGEKNESCCYYLVNIIGMGSTSKLFYALDSNGIPCVIKMFIKQTRKEKKGVEIKLDMKAFKQEAKKKMKLESDNLKKLYPVLKEMVKERTILGFHCVVMPFFSPLKQEERMRNKEKIKKVLERFHGANLEYAEGDLRWRHIGWYKEEIILYDLADLMSLGKESESLEEFVDRCWEELKGRLSPPSHPEADI